MELELGNFYFFHTWEIDDEWTYERNGTGRITDRFHATLYDEQYGIFIGTHGNYNMFASYLPHAYTNAKYEYIIYYVEKSEPVEELDYVPDFPIIDYIIQFAGTPEFPHPDEMSQNMTTTIRVSSKNVAAAIGKHMSGKKIARWMTALPPGPGFSGGPFYKRAKESFKGSSRRKRRRRSTRKNKSKQ